MTRTVLAIGGSDPTGGAGIQADIKTLTMLGVYAAAAITCVTVQNSHGVAAIQTLDPELVAAQIRAVLDDHHVYQVKIGMVGSAPIARAIGESLDGFEGDIVYDPVLNSTTGQDLMEKSGLDLLKKELLRRTTVLTPNLPELARLTGTDGSLDVRQAATDLLDGSDSLQAVIVKGGHYPGQQIEDSFFCRKNEKIHRISITHHKIKTANTHGTGCTFASALAAYLCLGCSREQAFRKTVALLQHLLDRSADKRIIRHQDGCGPMLHSTGIS
ncbi:bifunctional hydroxymethylpyrimidine kinase/phosphomethylpyrimidine kinase [Desulfolithobacter sp.]